jgi:YD repeat-containing protein
VESFSCGAQRSRYATLRRAAIEQRASAQGNRWDKNSSAQLYEFTPDDRLESVTVADGGWTVNFTYDYAGQRVMKEVVGGSVTRYYSDLVETTSDGVMTKSYFLGGMRVASRSTNDVGWQFAAQTDSPIRVASAWVGRPALVLFLRSDVQLALGTSFALLTAALLVAPWRRKRVVGVAVHHGT